ncbi:rhodanese-like domain-containing protein [Marinobacter halodurans]|uniref:Rhodanese-like domain-containing protein n=1 Tax=Marinobacter halodurans TaxID=2528979 RepID=A0ABY1ZKX5_9GAMM|nr:rhodanese-like domain-containing protein [Marinobacter halodurans]TBW56059.1 rhodanese-like domain-containing protein [Marinobacter halodurans]
MKPGVRLANLLPVCFMGVLSAWSLTAMAQGYSGECRAEKSYLAQLGIQPDWPGRERSSQCFVSLDPETAEADLIVDVRPTDDFKAAHIASSVNLSPNELLHSNLLKHQRLLVVDKGFQTDAMAELCARAEQAGVKTLSILRYGLAGWVASGRSLVGQPDAINELNRVSSEEFSASMASDDLRLIVNTSDKSTLEKIEALRRLSDRTTRSREENLQKVLQDILITTGDSSKILLVGFDDQADDLASKYQAVFSFSDSLRDLRILMARQEDIAGKRGQIPQRYRCGG